MRNSLSEVAIRPKVLFGIAYYLDPKETNPSKKKCVSVYMNLSDNPVLY